MIFSFDRCIAIVRKEFSQMKRDHVSVGMILVIPLIQLILFGFAINTNPKALPTAVIVGEHSQFSRSFIRGMENTAYFRVAYLPKSEAAARKLMAEGKVLFVVSIPSDFTRRFIRQEHPSILVEADATDSVAVNGAVGALKELAQRVFSDLTQGVLGHLKMHRPTVDLVLHRQYNPESITQYNIVPALLGVVLTMTLVMVTSMAITRERERGTMESLLATPVKPLEVMIGKIIPYILIGYVQVCLILAFAWLLFHVPMRGSIGLLLLCTLPFIAANLSVGLTFSSIANNQLQAMQMAFFFFLPSILLSGFMFPFYGMPQWAQWIGRALPLTYFLRIVRGVILKGNDFWLVWPDVWPMLVFMTIVLFVAWKRYRRTLD